MFKKAHAYAEIISDNIKYFFWLNFTKEGKIEKEKAVLYKLRHPEYYKNLNRDKLIKKSVKILNKHKEEYNKAISNR